MQLSPHFSLAELTNSATATRLGIDNSPPHAYMARLKLVAAEILEPARAYFGRPIRPSSGYRCLALNRALGSKDTSQHVRGEAVDFEVHDVANIDLARWLEAQINFDQLILEFHDPGDPKAGWVHCSYAADGVQRGEVLTIGRACGARAGLG